MRLHDIELALLLFSHLPRVIYFNVPPITSWQHYLCLLFLLLLQLEHTEHICQTIVSRSSQHQLQLLPDLAPAAVLQEWGPLGREGGISWYQ